jgi:sulfoxide reductase heme-binding subunit YedZ
MAKVLNRRLSNKEQIRLLKIITHLGALIPLTLLLWDYRQGQLGVDPIREITLRTGKTTLVLLFLSLAVTPVNIVLGWKRLLPLRRLLGLYAFFYVCLHLLSFVWLDYLFDWLFIWEGIVEQRYVLVGFTAFLLMLPLALTSSKWSMRRLGKRWKSLHQLIYLIGALAIIHYLWLVKNYYTEPLIYAAILILLLLTRIKSIKQRILRWRRGPKGKRVRQRPVPAGRSLAHSEVD